MWISYITLEKTIIYYLINKSGPTHYNHFLLESILLQGGFHSASSSSTRKSEFHPAIFLFIAMLPFLGLFFNWVMAILAIKEKFCAALPFFR